MAPVTLPEVSYLYDLEPGVIVETDKPLDADQLEHARDDYLSAPSKAKHEAVARGLNGSVYKPKASAVVRVGVDQAELDSLLKRAYPDEAERARIEGKLRG